MFTPTLYRRHFYRDEAPAARRVVGYVPASNVRQEADNMLNGLFTQMLAPWAGLDFLTRRADGSGQDAVLMPRLDVASDDKAYTITAELPGVRPEDVTLEVKEQTLFLKGEKKEEKTDESREVHISERTFGSFERVMGLPDDAALDGITALHKDGILTVSIPRKAPEQPQSRSITIATE